MRSKEEIAELITSNRAAIIENLDSESIQVYAFLRQEYQKGRVYENSVFQFVYRSFYRLDNAGLSKAFKTEYFRIMEEFRDQTDIDPVLIIKRLYCYKRLKGDNSLQFSFTTKLINMICPSYPIYDSEVARVFRFHSSGFQDIDLRIQELLINQAYLIDTYRILSERVSTALELFDKQFQENNLCTTKKLDFIIWSAGKLIASGQLA